MTNDTAWYIEEKVKFVTLKSLFWNVDQKYEQLCWSIYAGLKHEHEVLGKHDIAAGVNWFIGKLCII